MLCPMAQYVIRCTEGMRIIILKEGILNNYHRLKALSWGPRTGICLVQDPESTLCTVQDPESAFNLVQDPTNERERNEKRRRQAQPASRLTMN